MADSDVFVYLYVNEDRGKINALFTIFMLKNATRCILFQRREILLEINNVYNCKV